MKKNIILSLIAVLSLMSCQSEKDKLNEKITLEVQKAMKDPKSVIIDSIAEPKDIKLSESLTMEAIVYATQANEELREALDDARMAYIMSIGSSVDNEYRTSSKEHQKSSELLANKRDSVENISKSIKKTDKDVVEFKIFKVYGQAANSYGGMVNMNVVALMNVKTNEIVICEDNLDEVGLVMVNNF